MSDSTDKAKAIDEADDHNFICDALDHADIPRRPSLWLRIEFALRELGLARHRVKELEQQVSELTKRLDQATRPHETCAGRMELIEAGETSHEYQCRRCGRVKSTPGSRPEMCGAKVYL